MPAAHDVEMDGSRVEIDSSGAAAVALTRATPWESMAGSAWALLPGAGVTAAIALVATLLGGLVPVVGAPVIAILCGIVISLVKRPSPRLLPGISFTAKKVLQGSIVVLGFGLSLGQVLSTGTGSLPVLVGTLVAALAMAWLAGRLLRLPAVPPRYRSASVPPSLRGWSMGGPRSQAQQVPAIRAADRP